MVFLLQRGQGLTVLSNLDSLRSIEDQKRVELEKMRGRVRSSFLRKK